MVYYNPYKRILRAFMRAIKVFFGSLLSKSVLITIICFLVLLLFINENHVEASSITTTGNEDIYQEMRDYELKYQDDFILFCYYPFIENTDLWVNSLKPIFDEIKNDHKYVYITVSNPISETNNITIRYTLNVYRQVMPATYTTGSFKSQVDNRTYNIEYQVCESPYITYLDYNTSTKESTIQTVIRTRPPNNTYTSNLNVMKPCVGLYSDKWLHFMELVYGGSSSNYGLILNDIKDYLESIDDMTQLNNYCLNMIMQTLDTIANKTENDYTSQIDDISSQVNNLNSSIQAQTQQQHQDAQATQNAINNQTTKIEEQTNSINDMSDFMQDDSFTSDSITNNMPSSDEFQDVTESGFDNIFTTLRNAFTSDNYQDVEFEVPFSNGQKITIPSNLTENIIPTAIKTLIQMVYWYFIARFIVKDIAGYIEKAKSGDIFSSSDTNIKTDML